MVTIEVDDRSSGDCDAQALEGQAAFLIRARLAAVAE